MSNWPAAFFDRRAGVGCPHCIEGRPSETEHGARFYEGRSSDGYLQRSAPTPGYSVVIFRERHVADLQSMNVDELTRFWSEVAIVSRAIGQVFQPVHLNVQLLGNAVPHVHVHLVARYDPDPAPCQPLPSAAWENAQNLGESELRAQLDALTTTLGGNL
ncbi:MAG: HIT family protein [Ilumatobacteraceae bacterium]